MLMKLSLISLQLPLVQNMLDLGSYFLGGENLQITKVQMMLSTGLDFRLAKLCRLIRCRLNLSVRLTMGGLI